MQLNFKYTYELDGNEIELAVTAKHYRGYPGKYPEPDEPEEIEIIAVVGPDGFVYDDNDLLEDWPLIEAKAWEQLEIENTKIDERLN